MFKFLAARLATLPSRHLIPGMAVDKPKAKKGSVSSTRDPAKGVELKSASEVEMEGTEETKDAEKAKESSEPKGDAGEKRPHTPRSGLVLRSAEEVQRKKEIQVMRHLMAFPQMRKMSSWPRT